MIKDTLNKLVAFTEPIETLENEMSKVPWDIEPVVIITYSNLIEVFERFLKKEISASDLERWAELIEARDGIDYESKSDLPGIVDIIFQLANPEINNEITDQSILDFYNSIKQ